MLDLENKGTKILRSLRKCLPNNNLSYSGGLECSGMPLREPQMLHFSQLLVFLLLFDDAAGGTQQGKDENIVCCSGLLGRYYGT
jgi:hypothetical protein